MKDFFNAIKDMFNSKGNSSEENLFPSENNSADANNTYDEFIDDAFIDGAKLSGNTWVYLKK